MAKEWKNKDEVEDDSIKEMIDIHVEHRRHNQKQDIILGPKKKLDHHQIHAWTVMDQIIGPKEHYWIE